MLFINDITDKYFYWIKLKNLNENIYEILNANAAFVERERLLNVIVSQTLALALVKR